MQSIHAVWQIATYMWWLFTATRGQCQKYAEHRVCGQYKRWTYLLWHHPSVFEVLLWSLMVSVFAVASLVFERRRVWNREAASIFYAVYGTTPGCAVVGPSDGLREDWSYNIRIAEVKQSVKKDIRKSVHCNHRLYVSYCFICDVFPYFFPYIENPAVTLVSVQAHFSTNQYGLCTVSGGLCRLQTPNCSLRVAKYLHKRIPMRYRESCSQHSIQAYSGILRLIRYDLPWNVCKTLRGYVMQC